MHLFRDVNFANTQILHQIQNNSIIYFAPNIDLSIVKFCTKLRFSCGRVVRKQTFFNSYSHLFLNHAYVHFLILRMNSLLFPKICVSWHCQIKQNVQMTDWLFTDYEYTKLNKLKEVQSRGVLLSVFGISIISQTPDLSLWVTNMSDRGRQEQPGKNLRPDAMLFGVKPQPFQEFHSSLFRRLLQRHNSPLYCTTIQ